MKKNINLEKRKVVGEYLAEDIFDEKGLLIIGKDIMINEYIYNRLNEFGVTEVCVYEDIKDAVKESNSELLEFKNTYCNEIKKTKDIFSSLKRGESIDIETIINQSDNLYPKDLVNNYELVDRIKVLKNVDEYTYTHGINVGLYSFLIGRWLGLGEKDVKDLLLAGILHDLGKTRIPNYILNKPSNLLPSEFKMIKRHSMEGYNIVKDIPGINSVVKKTVLMHHEREDGSGYPLGIKGDRISLYTKIVTVADVYDAITSKRVYKPSKTPFETFEILIKTGFGHLDTKIMLVFMENIAQN